MFLKALLTNLTDYNADHRYDQTICPWLDWDDFPVFLDRCIENDIPVFGVDIFSLCGNDGWIYIDTLIHPEAHGHSGDLDFYKDWNRKLQSGLLAQAMLKLFSLEYSNTSYRFVPTGMWERL